jgi:hypothetical protein
LLIFEKNELQNRILTNAEKSLANLKLLRTKVAESYCGTISDWKSDWTGVVTKPVVGFRFSSVAI